ncbi:hypothetical protein N0V90_002012 [Kalmusia sp. IMI 367209]|nr:hypothetical protein N0V90_002012 [Kalmusia sp. IMI 367209]
MPKRRSNKRGRPLKSALSSDTIFFYLPSEIPYGIFCQWHPSSITLPTTSLSFLVTKSTAHHFPAPILASYSPTITFSCAEQLFMFCKSLFFADAGTCARILSTPDPKEQKKLGKEVTGFNEYKWTRMKSRVARVGNWYKFRDEALKAVLLGTGERELVEASSKDRVWGIGFKEKNAEVNRKEWGENRLGRALMRVRERLRELARRQENEIVDWEWDGGVKEEVEDTEDNGKREDVMIKEEVVAEVNKLHGEVE